jgi:hypothetical protein
MMHYSAYAVKSITIDPTVGRPQWGSPPGDDRIGCAHGFEVSLARSVTLAFGLVVWMPAQAGAAGPDCMRFWGEVRYVAGYDHIVYVANGCDADASCIVWTDVNPTPLAATIPAHSTVGIVTYRGSPASVFTPFVRCSD